jgi:hypothetical protein
MIGSESLDKASQELVYTVLGHSGLESSRIPLDPNSLLFPSKVIDDKFIRKVMCAKDDELHLSETLKNSLVLFYAALTLLVVGGLVVHSLKYAQKGDISVEELAVHIVVLLGLYGAAYGVLLLFVWRLRLRKHMRQAYLVYMLLLVSYLELGDQRVISKLVASESSINRLNYPLILQLFLYLYSLISFSHFLGVLLVSAYSLALYLGLQLYASSDQLEVAVEFLFLTAYCVCLCFKTHQTELRARHLFWRLEKEENAIEVKIEVVDRHPSAGATFNTERERLIELCDSIKRKIKAAASVVVYKDVKAQLKTAVVEVDNVRRRVAVVGLNEGVKFDSLDAQDREFIMQQFYHSSPSKQNSQKLTMADRKATMMAFGQEEQVNGLLAGLGTNWAFDIWQLHKTSGHSIRLIGLHLFQKWEFLGALGVADAVITAFFKEVEKGYLPNPYHNACHGADVCHSMLYFIDIGGVLKDLTGIELGSAIIAALAHDIGHPGVTNRYLITNKEKIAMRYNDVSVLENMHAALLYKILGKEECNILRNLPHEDWTDSRRCIIGMILSTDMGKHFEVLGQFRARTQTSSDINLQKSEDRMFLLSMAIKCADLGHSAKPVLLHQKWSELVLAEFFSQGDLERDKGLPVSMYCDRDTTDIPKSQAGFIRNICLPLFEAWTDYLRCEEVNRVVLQQLAENLGMWEAKGRLPAVQRDRGSPNPKVAVGLSMEDLEEM